MMMMMMMMTTKLLVFLLSAAMVQSVLVEIPNTKELQERFWEQGWTYFDEKSHLIEMIEGRSMEALGVYTQVGFALDTFAKYVNNPAVSITMKMMKGKIVKEILRDSKEAIQELQEYGFLSYTVSSKCDRMKRYLDVAAVQKYVESDEYAGAAPGTTRTRIYDRLVFKVIPNPLNKELVKTIDDQYGMGIFVSREEVYLPMRFLCAKDGEFDTFSSEDL